MSLVAPLSVATAAEAGHVASSLALSADSSGSTNAIQCGFAISDEFGVVFMAPPCPPPPDPRRVVDKNGNHIVCQRSSFDPKTGMPIDWSKIPAGPTLVDDPCPFGYRQVPIPSDFVRQPAGASTGINGAAATGQGTEAVAGPGGAVAATAFGVVLESGDGGSHAGPVATVGTSASALASAEVIVPGERVGVVTVRASEGELVVDRGRASAAPDGSGSAAASTVGVAEDVAVVNRSHIGTDDDGSARSTASTVTVDGHNVTIARAKAANAADGQAQVTTRSITVIDGQVTITQASSRSAPGETPRISARTIAVTDEGVTITRTPAE